MSFAVSLIPAVKAVSGAAAPAAAGAAPAAAAGAAIPGLNMVLGGLSLISGLGGLFGGRKSRPSLETRMRKQMTRQQLQAIMDMLKTAQAYDPAKEAQAAVDYSARTTEQTIKNALNNLYASWGGNQAGDSEFAVRAQGVTDRAADPLRAFAADRMSRLTPDKLQLLSSIVGLNAGGLLKGISQPSSPSVGIGPSIEAIASGLKMLGGK